MYLSLIDTFNYKADILLLMNLLLIKLDFKEIFCSKGLNNIVDITQILYIKVVLLTFYTISYNLTINSSHISL